MSAKHDPFFSIRSGLKEGAVIECRLPYDNGKHFYGSLAPYYYWENREYPSSYRSHQLLAADAFQRLTWEVIEENRPLDIERVIAENAALEAPVEGKVYYRWRKRLVSLNDEGLNLPKIERPPLGGRMLVTAKAGRNKFWRKNEHGIDQCIAQWGSFPVTPIEAIFIGYRIVFEGIIEKPSYNSEDVGNFIIVRSLVIWKFVSHERKADFYVLPQDTREIRDV